MATPLLTTKLYVPPVRPEWVPRPHLIERLNEGLSGKLTLFSAPAGFGKTTLARDWLNGVQRPSVWLTLDEGDNDPVRFLAYLVAALQRVDARIGEMSESLLGSPPLPPVDAWMTGLINDIAAAAEPFVLVLDDYQIIHTAPVHEAIDFLIAHQPPQMHLVLITRHDPPLPLPRLRVRGEVTEIRADDLRFTTAETAAFLQQVGGLTLDSRVVAALGARTEGWVAGLQLAALSMRGRPPERVAEQVAAFSGSHRHVIDYLADEVLAQQPAEIRDFLRQTAVLDRLTAPLCDALRGREDSAVILQQLEQANLFLIPLDEQRAWYRYHRLFADYLRTELDEASRAALHQRAARWFVANDLLPEAVDHALASGDMDLATQVIASAAEQVVRDGAVMTLLGWLDALPDQVVRSHSELATYKGLVLFFMDRHAEAAAYAAAAEQCLPPDAPALNRGQLLSLQAHLALCVGTLDDTIRLAQKAVDGLGDADPVLHSLTLNVLGQALEMKGDLPAAAEVYRQATRTGREARNHLGTMVLLTNLVLALNMLGQRREALAICQRVLDAGASETGSKRRLAEAIELAWGTLSYEADELELAYGQLSRAVRLCQQAGLVAGTILGQYALARVHLARGEIDTTLGACREGYQHAVQLGRGSLQGAWFAALEARAHLRQGDLAAAARWAEAAQLIPADMPAHWFEPVYTTYARLLLAQNRLEEAQTLLTTTARSAQQGGRLRHLITANLQQALVQRALGHPQEALALVEGALRLAAPEDYRRAFLDEGPELLELLPPLRHAAPDFVAALVGDIQVGEALARPQPLVEPLSEQELEVLRHLAAGLTYQQIADRLFVSLNTVRFHVKNIYGKLGVHSRSQAVARAGELDLL